MKPVNDKDEVKELRERVVALKGRWLLASGFESVGPTPLAAVENRESRVTRFDRSSVNEIGSATARVLSVLPM